MTDKAFAYRQIQAALATDEAGLWKRLMLN